ncbi:MAG TPA: hypothetical protein VI485_16145 [Vicinamibacterales bacterium]|nr:hypothetical protein [Vicinamibacterales bacterium]
MSKKWVIAGLTVLLFSTGAAWLTAAPSIGTVAATPAYVVVDTATPVLFTAQIADSSVIPTGVNLLNVDAAGKTIAIIGVMRDDGSSGDLKAGDKVFSLRATVNRPAVGQAFYRVSAAFKGVLQRVQSSSIELAVWSHYVDTESPVAFALPPEWSIENNDGVLGLSSPTLRQLRDDPESPPANILVAIRANETLVPLDSFIRDNHGDWFGDYKVRTTPMVDGKPAIRFADWESTIPHNPIDAVFVSSGDVVVVVTFYPEDTAPGARMVFDRFISTLSIEP